MPLKDHLPVIDDRRYDDIMDEVRTRIARYTPEWTPVWTDVNDNDPGVTMVQLFAWMTEMLIYRLGKVPELNYLKFLQLLGIELYPAEPAKSEITFPVSDSHPDATLIVPPGTQVSAEAADGGRPIVFETDRALVAHKATLTSVQAYDGYFYVPVTEVNKAAVTGYEPFGPRANPESALLLGFTFAGEFPEAELDLTFWLREGMAQVRRVSCGLPASAVYASARLRWEYWNSTSWQPLNQLKDETQAFTRSGHVILKTPPVGRMKRAIIGEEPLQHYWVRAVVVSSQYERVPTLLAVRTNTVAATQAESVSDEVLGGSNGRRDQTFALADSPVLLERLRIEVDEGSGYQPWQRKDDFFGSGADDPHFVLNRTTGEVRFGDGVNGRIPVSNGNNPVANVVARFYRFGGGQRGNVAARTLHTVATPVEGVDSGEVYNLLAAHSGRDEETLDEAIKRAPSVVKSRSRAVTSEDFELLAGQAANVKRARAMPLLHPDFPGVRVPGVMTVIVVPDAPENVPNPMPSEGTLRTVCAYLDQRRLLTTEVYVIAPTYQHVLIDTEIIVEETADTAEVKLEIERTLLDYLHPLKGGEEKLGWPFGGTLYYSRVAQRILAVSGVQSIQRLLIELDGEEMEECRDVPIREAALIYSTEHRVDVHYSFEE